MITMLLGGLWHGAAWTFVVWGAYQGLMLAIGREIQAWSQRRGIRIPEGLHWKRIALTLLMFHVTCYGWLIFRSRSVAQVVALTSRIADGFLASVPELPTLLLPVVLIVGPLLVVHIYQAVVAPSQHRCRLCSRFGTRCIALLASYASLRWDMRFLTVRVWPR